jgi:hypothetical protein
MGGACSTYGENRCVYMALVWKPEVNNPLGRPGSRWEDNINTDLQDVGCGGMGWIDFVQDMNRWRALVNGVMNHRFP